MTCATKLGEKLTAADSVAALALVALAEGRIPDAERLAKESVAAYERQDAPDGHAMARAALARALLAAGRGDAAMAEARRAQELVGKTQNVIVKLATAITVDRVQGLSRSQNARTAIADLERAHAQATAMGLVPLALEASVAIAEVSAQADRPAAEARLAALEKEARTRGLGGIAAEAAAARQTPRR